MTPLEFAKLVEDTFRANGWTKCRLEVSGLIPTVCMDAYLASVRVTKVEKIVCALVQENNIDPTKVRFDQEHGHVMVQLRDDLGEKSLATRSIWKRLPVKSKPQEST